MTKNSKRNTKLKHLLFFLQKTHPVSKISVKEWLVISLLWRKMTLSHLKFDRRKKENLKRESPDLKLRLAEIKLDLEHLRDEAARLVIGLAQEEEILK